MGGTIVQLNEERGFGFVRAADGVDYFLHVSEVGDVFYDLRPGDVVTFDAFASAKGPRGKNLQLLRRAS